MTLNGRDLERLRDAFVAAYDVPSLETLLRFKLNKRLDALVSSNATFETTVFQLLGRAEREGWLPELISRAAELRSQNLAIVTVCSELLHKDNPAQSHQGGTSGPTRPIVGLGNAKELKQAPTEFPLLLPPNNLPYPLTSFIGRDRELVEVKEQLRDSRLVTLVGSGGCGKTRLAIQTAMQLRDSQSFPNGLFLIELASLANPLLVTQSVAKVVGVAEQSGCSVADTLADALKSRRMLLLLDNCEHLVDAVAELAEKLLSECPNLRIMTTSRQQLSANGETVFRVPPLKLPNKVATNPQTVQDSEAGRLFFERATAASNTFAITHHNALAVGSICHRLDGIPLAIELAAGQTLAMTVEEINVGLEDAFSILTRGKRTALPQHRTLLASIDWSFTLLSRQEQTLLARLSVFAGGWTRDAAEAVCSRAKSEEGTIEQIEVGNLLTDLCAKSLVVMETHGVRSRFHLLETVRQYGHAKLRERGEATWVNDRHSAYFLSLAEAVEPKLTGSDQKDWLDYLEIEHDNFRAALSWSRSGDFDKRESGRLMCGALWWFWWTRGYITEGIEQCKFALEGHSKPTWPRAKALFALGALAKDQGDYITAQAAYQEGLDICIKLQFSWGIANSWNNLGVVAFERGNFEEAQKCYDESLSLLFDVDDKRCIAYLLYRLAELRVSLSDFEQAYIFAYASLHYFEEIGDRQGIAYSIHSLGIIAYKQHDQASARSFLKCGLKIRADIGDIHNVILSLESLATVGASVSLKNTVIEDEEGITTLCMAIRLHAATQSLRERIGSTMTPAAQAERLLEIAAVRNVVDAKTFEEKFAEGIKMTLEHAIDCAFAV